MTRVIPVFLAAALAGCCPSPRPEPAAGPSLPSAGQVLKFTNGVKCWSTAPAPGTEIDARFRLIGTR